ncbi:MAG: hypothetical protein L0312_26325 [Acidobacteria bacterium]|nr:hypothetical protein [Acidobacteriota bacterium]
MTQPTIDTTQTLLVGMTFGLPRQSRLLKQVSNQAEAKAKAAPGTTRYSLHYWKWDDGNKHQDGLEPLKKFQTAYKSALEHFARFPFATGAKLLPAALVEPFLKVKEVFEKQQGEVWKHWIYEVYPKLAGSAPTRMGQFYSGEDFPTAEDCMERFVCEVTMIPLASADQWKRIALLAPDLAAAQEVQTNQAYQKGMTEGHAKLCAEFMEPIQHAVAVLSKDGSKIYETLLGNIIKIVDIIPAYTPLFKDNHLEQSAAQAKEAFSKYTTEDLKKSDEARKAILASAKSIVSSFSQYQRKFA